MELNVDGNLDAVQPYELDTTLGDLSVKQVQFFVDLVQKAGYHTIDEACEAVSARRGHQSIINPMQCFKYMSRDAAMERRHQAENVAASQKLRVPSDRQRETLRLWIANISDAGVAPDLAVKGIAVLSDFNATMFTFTRALDVFHDCVPEYRPARESLSWTGEDVEEPF